MRRVERFENAVLKFIEINPEEQSTKRRFHSQLPSLQLSRVTVGMTDTEQSPYVFKQFGQRNQKNKTPIPFFKPFNINTDYTQRIKTKILLRKFQALKKIGNSSFR
ncbi:unnamed protein product [Paramecium octaurelia]|uniref:Uncharacterized protein n=1 Tax=Paramecium octaurelia TaxID=43137 RepID=A0A8S1WBG3_PAROT|nr:unnamed protein product [Paramecium octaurelia]